jgi:DUF971 family protein
MTGTAWPVELVYRRGARTLSARFDDGAAFDIPAELLRIGSPSAEVKGHGGGPPALVRGKEHVAISAMEPVGNYAVRIVFDDGHATGLYSWRLLYGMGRDREAMMADYRKRLAEGV